MKVFFHRFPNLKTQDHMYKKLASAWWKIIQARDIFAQGYPYDFGVCFGFNSKHTKIWLLLTKTIPFLGNDCNHMCNKLIFLQILFTYCLKFHLLLSKRSEIHVHSSRCSGLSPASPLYHQRRPNCPVPLTSLESIWPVARLRSVWRKGPQPHAYSPPAQSVSKSWGLVQGSR